MNKLTNTDLEIGSIYATFWRMVHMSVHKYDCHPTGELLTIMTIALLHKAGYSPTISELVEITGVNKSNVSRYVSRQMKEGFLTEVVDSQDRRRRRLHSTQQGKKNEQWHENQTLQMARLTNEALRGAGESKDSVADLKKILLSMNGNAPEAILGAL